MVWRNLAFYVDDGPTRPRAPQDEQTMMPHGAAGARGGQKAALAGVVHEKATAPQLGEVLDRLQSTQGLDARQAAVVRDAARSYRKKTAIPKELAQRMARLESEAFDAWAKARKENDWALFAPYLAQWVEVTREKARLIDPSRPAYEVCLDDFERGMTVGRLDEIFGAVQQELVPLLRDLKAKGKAPARGVVEGSFDADKQAQLCKEVAMDLGFDTTRGEWREEVGGVVRGGRRSGARSARWLPEGAITGKERG